MARITPTMLGMPPEIKEYITNFLPGTDVLKVAQVHRNLARHYSDANKVTWKRKCQEEYPDQTQLPITTWKRHYINLHHANLPFNRGYREGFNSAPNLGRKVGIIAGILRVGGIGGIAGAFSGAVGGACVGISGALIAAEDIFEIADACAQVGVIGGTIAGAGVAGAFATGSVAAGVGGGGVVGMGALVDSAVYVAKICSAVGGAIGISGAFCGTVLALTDVSPVSIGASVAAGVACMAFSSAVACANAASLTASSGRIINTSSNLGEKITSLSPVRKLCGLIGGSGQYLKSKIRR